MGTWRIAWRNVFRNPRRTLIVVTAIAVGVGGAVFAMAINYGMVFQMVENAIDRDLGHLQIHAPGYGDDPGIAHRLAGGGAEVVRALEAEPAVRAFAPRLRGQALVFSPRASAGAELVGVEPEREREVTRIAESLSQGRYLGSSRRRVLVGAVLARRLTVKIGDKIVISVQDASGDLTGEAFRIAGIFDTASRDFDGGTIFLPLASAQALYGVGDDLSELVVVAHDRSEVEPLRDDLAARLDGKAEVRSWDQTQPLLRYMVELFDQMGWIVYGAVFVAMAFGIANVMLMAVHERIREIGILTAVGMRPRRLVGMIALESVVLTVIGLLLGLGLGLWAVASLQDGIDLSRWGEGLSDFGVGARIVPTLRRADLVIPAVAAAITALLAGLWPALRAARLRPAEAVRHT